MQKDKNNKDHGSYRQQRLFLAGFNGITILASNNFYPARANHLVRLHLERRVSDDEGPHIVTETVGAEMALGDRRCKMEAD